MKALVTGAAGFIGSHVVDRLLARGYEVVGFDNYSTGRPEFLSGALSNAAFQQVRGDILDAPGLEAAMRGAEVVYHLAANADIRGGVDQPGKDLEQNIIGTFRVLEAMRSVGASRIIFASSAAALGEPSVFPTPEACPIPVQTSLYGTSKMAGEGLISSYCEAFGFEGYAFRFVSLLGPRYQHGHVYDFVKQLLENPNELRILGDGSQSKSYLHVEDCVTALMLLCEDLREARNVKHRFDVYHLGFPAYIQVRESASLIASALGLQPKFVFGGGSRGWVGDNPFVFLDVQKARSKGWQPKHDIEDSIKSTAQWLFGNQWIFEKSSASRV